MVAFQPVCIVKVHLFWPAALPDRHEIIGLTGRTIVLDHVFVELQCSPLLLCRSANGQVQCFPLGASVENARATSSRHAALHMTAGQHLVLSAAIIMISNCSNSIAHLAGCGVECNADADADAGLQRRSQMV